MAQAERMTASAEDHVEVVAAGRHVLQDLGWEVVRTDEGLRGSATITPQMHVPGTEHLRTSILAIWADALAGHLAVDTISPRVPVTLELDVHLYRPTPGDGLISGSGRIVKAGRSVFVASVDFETGDGDPVGFAAATFVPAPDARLTIQMPQNWDQARQAAEPPRLTVPFAERAGCARVAPGVAALSPSDEKLNASNTLNGGLIALNVEEALLSLLPRATVSSLDMRYLQPARIGPVVARADEREGLGRVEVRDEGNDDRLCVVATSRFFPQ
jgi:acyl-coenzyme A thioesterase PaaI-like protein